MNKAGIYHQCKDQWCYALDEDTLHIRLKTAYNDIDAIEIYFGDPFEWSTHKASDPSQTSKHAWNSTSTSMQKAGTDGIHDFWEIRIKPPYKRLKYWFLVHAGSESYEYGEKGLVSPYDRYNTWNTFVFPYIHESEVYKAPEWAHDRIWYQIFPERFFNGKPSLNPKNTQKWQHGPVTNSELYGGNIPGITAKLDHIVKLGCNGLYLTPIFSSPSTHKYDTKDYLAIDPHFGTEEDLQELVVECHKRGIKIILDAVFNHSGVLFAPWQDVLEKGEDSQYRNWFVIDSFPLFGTNPTTGEPLQNTGDSHKANFKTFAFTTSMPKLNTTNKEVQEYLIKVATHYIRKFDIDGWRLDVANEVDHQFWRAFRTAVHRIKPEAYIVGEIWHNSIDWLKGDQYDAVMNYHFGQAITNFLLTHSEVPTGMALAHRIYHLEMDYPLTVVRAGFNLLDSHDTARLLHMLNNDIKLARIAWIILMFLPASPCIYYGSEYGIKGGYDPDCRRCMPWETPQDQEEGQEEFIKTSIALRKKYLDLIQKGKRTFIFDTNTDLFGIHLEVSDETKSASEEADKITLLVNRGSTVARYTAESTKTQIVIDAKSWKLF